MWQLLFLFLFLVAGLLLQKILSKELQVKLAYYLNRFVIYISLPAMVLVYLKSIKFDSTFFIPVTTAWGVFFISLILIYLLSKIFNFSKEMLIALIMLVSFTNSSFLGIPFTKAFFGESAIKYAIIYDQLGSFLILSIFGVLIISIYRAKSVNFILILIKIVSFPSFIALIVVILVDDIIYPNYIELILKVLTNLLAPFSLISIGLNIVLKMPKNEIFPIILALILKLVLIPLFLILLFKIVNINTLAVKISIFEASMAPMVTSSMLAIMANIKPRFVATTLGYGIAFSFITLPIIYLII